MNVYTLSINEDQLAYLVNALQQCDLTQYEDQVDANGNPRVDEACLLLKMLSDIPAEERLSIDLGANPGATIHGLTC